jgi:hypothetical protein
MKCRLSVSAPEGLASAVTIDNSLTTQWLELTLERATLTEIDSSLFGDAGLVHGSQKFDAKFKNVALTAQDLPRLRALIKEATASPWRSEVQVRGTIDGIAFKAKMEKNGAGRSEFAFEGLRFADEAQAAAFLAPLQGRGVRQVKLEGFAGGRRIKIALPATSASSRTSASLSGVGNEGQERAAIHPVAPAESPPLAPALPSAPAPDALAPPRPSMVPRPLAPPQARIETRLPDLAALKGTWTGTLSAPSTFNRQLGPIRYPATLRIVANEAGDVGWSLEVPGTDLDGSGIATESGPKINLSGTYDGGRLPITYVVTVTDSGLDAVGLGADNRLYRLALQRQR